MRIKDEKKFIHHGSKALRTRKRSNRGMAKILYCAHRAQYEKFLINSQLRKFSLLFFAFSYVPYTQLCCCCFWETMLYVPKKVIYNDKTIRRGWEVSHTLHIISGIFSIFLYFYFLFSFFLSCPCTTLYSFIVIIFIHDHSFIFIWLFYIF